jgi:hypothetical protein
VRFKTGAIFFFNGKAPTEIYTVQATSGDVIDIIRQESMARTKEDIAIMLNDGGYLSGKGLQFTAESVGALMRTHNILSLKEHLKAKGYITAREKAAELNMDYSTFHKMRTADRLDCSFVKTSGNGDYMFSP